MAESFKPVELFGGAMTVNVPAGYDDVSKIRQVPDHQEVYLSSNGFSSLIFDLTELVTGENIASTEDALKYHFNDIVDDNDARQIWSIKSEGAAVPHLPPNTPAMTLFATTTPPTPSSADRQRPNTPTSVTIMMGLIRLLPQATDVAITLNIPRIPGVDDEEVDFENGKFGKAVEEGREIIKEVWRTLDIKDWSLFDPA